MPDVPEEERTDETLDKSQPESTTNNSDEEDVSIERHTTDQSGEDATKILGPDDEPERDPRLPDSHREIGEG